MNFFFELKPITKASWVSIFFAGAGIAGFINSPQQSLEIAFALFYATITVNTFFSIRFFAEHISTKDEVQKGMDVLLVLIYLALAACMSDPVLFMGVAFLLFLTATTKYWFLRKKFSHPATLRRKIRIDLLGTSWCVAALLGAAFGYPVQSAWIFSLGFLGANIYWLFVKPMYQIQEES